MADVYKTDEDNYIDDKSIVHQEDSGYKTIYEKIEEILKNTISETISLGADIRLEGNAVKYFNMANYAKEGYKIISIIPHSNGSGAVNYVSSWVSGMTLNSSVVTFKNLASTAIIGTFLVDIVYKKI